ncbi:MAG: hypothetical protein ACI9FJ_001754, partial [Alteromonadaceae bacterium]
KGPGFTAVKFSQGPHYAGFVVFKEQLLTWSQRIRYKSKE